MSDLETLKEMLTTAGIIFSEELDSESYHPIKTLIIFGGHVGFFTKLSFEHGALKACEAYE